MFESALLLLARPARPQRLLLVPAVNRFAAEFGKQYSTEAERLARERIFDARLSTIRAHNANPDHTWKRGVNHLTDWTLEELR